ncbi:MAG: ABC transporter permease [Cellulophaga sp.]
MLYYNFKYELKILLRSRWIQLISILLLVLFTFASFNGKQRIEKKKADISKAQETVQASDKKMVAILDSIEQGMDVSISRWKRPSRPIAIGNYHPRVAAMEPNNVGFLAVGQSDVFTHYVMPTVSGDDLALNYTELTSPIQLLFGSFDLMFVIVYLLPLLIIAFSYNVLSEEKERGSLRLLASQPISIHKWVLQKLALRLFWMSLIITVVSVIAFGINDVVFSISFLSFLGLVFCYMLFWFCLAFAINMSVGKSARNALSLLGLWIVFVLLLPSVISQLGDVFFRIPPRTEMIHEMRELKAEAIKKTG